MVGFKKLSLIDLVSLLDARNFGRLESLNDCFHSYCFLFFKGRFIYFIKKLLPVFAKMLAAQKTKNIPLKVAQMKSVPATF